MESTKACAAKQFLGFLFGGTAKGRVWTVKDSDSWKELQFMDLRVPRAAEASLIVPHLNRRVRLSLGGVRAAINKLVISARRAPPGAL